MRLSAYLVPALLLSTGPAQAETVKLAAFRTWGIHPVEPVSITAGALTVTVAATTCEIPAQNEGCRFDGVSNQAVVSVSRPGRAPFRMTSDVQASFVRVAIVRWSARADQYAVVVDNSWGGSASLTKVTIIEPKDNGFRAVPLTYHGRTELFGEVRVFSMRAWREGRPGFVLLAPGLNVSGECNACTPGVPLLLSVRQGRGVDMSADPAARTLFARDLPFHRRICVSEIRERNGNCVAYVADAARLGRLRSAWRIMLDHHRPEPKAYPAALRRYLLDGGYITPSEARALPLS